jgi:ribosomal protein S6--L-glutamate ligase
VIQTRDLGRYAVRLGILSQQARLYSTRRLAEAARRRGHAVRIIDHTHCVAVLGRAGPSVHFGGEPLRDLDAVIPRIGASVTAHGAAIVRQLESMGIPTAIRSLALRRARDKIRAHQMLVEAGIPIPRTAFAHRPHDLAGLTRHVGGAPVVIKLVEGTHGVGVVLADTEHAAASMLEAFSQLGARYVVQEYVAEAAGRDVRAFVVDGRVVAAMERRAGPGEFRANLHHGGSSSAIHLDPESNQIAISAARALGVDVAGVDMLPTSSGPLVLEVNASPGLEGIERSSKVDVAGAIVDYVERLHAERPVARRLAGGVPTFAATEDRGLGPEPRPRPLSLKPPGPDVH